MATVGKVPGHGLRATGYDPCQRSEQWKRRVEREEVSVCQQVLRGPPTGQHLDADARLEALQSALFGSLPNGGVPGSAAPQRLRSSGGFSVGSAGRAATARSAGRAILTPRPGGTPMVRPGTNGGMSSVGDNSVRSEATAILKAELAEETQRRQQAEEELQKLRTMLEPGVDVMSVRSGA